MATVETHEIPEHSLVVFHDVQWPTDSRDTEEMIRTLKADLGLDHVAFLNVQDRSSTVEVLSKHDSLPDWFARKIAEATLEAERHYTPQPPSVPAMMVSRKSIQGGTPDGV